MFLWYGTDEMLQDMQFLFCLVQASEEEMAEVEAATKQLLDTRGGNSPFQWLWTIHSTTSLQAKLWRLCFRLQWRNQEAEYRLQPRPRHRPHRCSLCPAVWLPKSKTYQVEGEKSLFVYQTPPSNRISYSGSWNGSQNLEIIILMNNPRLRKVLTRSWRRQKRGRKASKQKGWQML